MLKIGFDGRFIRQGQTGNGMFSQQLLEGLSRVDDENEYVVYLLEDKSFVRKKNFQLKRMPFLHANSYCRFFFTFPLEFSRNRVDIFHAIYTVPLKTPDRVILSMIEFSWFTNPDDFPASRLFLSQLRLMTKQSIRRADHIITPTHIGKEMLLNYFNLPEDKVAVIPFGVNEKFMHKIDDEEINHTKSKYSINGPYILYVGDLHIRKNLLRLIEAFDRLKKSREVTHQLVIVGKNLWRTDEIYKRAGSCASRDSIRFVGYVPFNDLRALYQGSELFAFPSLDEGFGLPVHEAMASRIPVIVSNRGALPEVAGDAALVVDPLSVEEIANAMLKIIESESLREKLVREGLKQIQGYSWEISCRKLLSFYKNGVMEKMGGGQ